MPVKFTVHHVVVDASGKVIKVVSEEYKKDADTTATVADYDATSSSIDVYAYASKSAGTVGDSKHKADSSEELFGKPLAGTVTDWRYPTKTKTFADGSPARQLSDSDKGTWYGYRHDDTFGSATYTHDGKTDTYTRKESGTVKADGSLELTIFYVAAAVPYKVQRLLVDGNGNVGAAADSPVTHYGYVGNKAEADGNRSGKASTTTNHVTKDDVKIDGYTYQASSFSYKSTKPYVSKPTTDDLDEGSRYIKGDGSTVLTLYYLADEHELRLHVTKDYGKFSGAVTGEDTTKRTDQLVVIKYRTGQTINALPADVVNTAANAKGKHFGTTANPYRWGYELVGWSTDPAGASKKGTPSRTQADLIAAYTKGAKASDYEDALKALRKVSSSATLETGAYTSADGRLFTQDGGSFTMPASDVDLFAVWKADEVTLTLVPAGTDNETGYWTSGNEKLGDPVKYVVDDDIDPLPCDTDITIERLGYELVGWSVSEKDQRTYETKGTGALNKDITYKGNKGQASLYTSAALEALGNDANGYRQFYYGDVVTPAYTMTPYNLTLVAVWRAKEITVVVHYWKVDVDADGKYDKATEVVADRTSTSMKKTYTDETIPYDFYTASGKITVKPLERKYAGYVLQADSVNINLQQAITASGTEGLPQGLSKDGKTVHSVTTGKIKGDATLRLDLFYTPDPNTPYHIQHWVIDGNGVGKLVVTTERKWYAGGTIKAINSKDDDRLYPAKDVSEKDIDWTGYEVELVDDTDYPYYVNKGDASKTKVHTKLTGTVTGDKSDKPFAGTTLVVVYKAKVRKLILDIGSYVTETDKAKLTPYNWGKYTSASDDTYWTSESDWSTGKTDTLPSTVPVRAGYTFKGWSHVKNGAYSKGTPSRTQYQDIVKDKDTQKAAVYTAETTLWGPKDWEFTMPQVSEDYYVMYAIWEANNDTEFHVLRYVVTLGVDENGKTIAVVKEAPTGTFDNTETGVTDDSIDLAQSVSEDKDSHIWRTYNKTDGVNFVPKGYNYITDKNYATFGGVKVSFEEDTLLTGKSKQDAATQATGTLDGSGKMVMRVFYVARPIHVYFNVVDHNGDDDGEWVTTISYLNILATSEKGKTYTGGPINNPITDANKQQAQEGYIYAGQTIVLPLDTTHVTMDNYTLIGWSLDDKATTKDATGKKNFDIRDGYGDATPSNLFGAYKDGSIWKYNGKWTVPDDMEDRFKAAPLSKDHNNLWAVFGRRAQYLIFHPEGYVTTDEVKTNKDTKMPEDPVKGGKWADDAAKKRFETGGITDPKNPMKDLEHNLGSEVDLPGVNTVSRPGYRLIGWTSDPTATYLKYHGLHSTAWGGSDAMHEFTEDGKTIYEIDYRRKGPDGTEYLPPVGSNFSGFATGSEIWTMPTSLQGPLDMYAVWEPLPAVIHFDRGSSAVTEWKPPYVPTAKTEDKGSMADQYETIGGTVTVPGCDYHRAGWEFAYWTVKAKNKKTGANAFIRGADNKPIQIKAADTFLIPSGDQYKISKFKMKIGENEIETEGLELTFVANWNQKKYTIRYNSSVGPNMGKSNPIIYTAKSFSKNTTYYGNTFHGWFTGKNGKGVEVTSKTRVADINVADDKSTITVYAYWTKNDYQVFYDTDGGSPVPDSRTVKWTGSGLMPKDKPTKPGMVFDGWWSDSGIQLKSGTQAYKLFATSDKISSLTFRAHWTSSAKSGGSFSMWTESDSEAVVIDESTATMASAVAPSSAAAPAKKSVAYKAAAVSVQAAPAIAVNAMTVGVTASTNEVAASATASNATIASATAVSETALVRAAAGQSTASSAQADVVLVSAPSQSAEAAAPAGSATPAATDAVPATPTTTTTTSVPASNTSLPPVSSTSAVTPAAVTSGSDDDDKRAAA